MWQTKYASAVPINLGLGFDFWPCSEGDLPHRQSYIHQVLQTIQMKLILLCVWAEPAVLGIAKIALRFIFEI